MLVHKDIRPNPSASTAFLFLTPPSTGWGRRQLYYVSLFHAPRVSRCLSQIEDQPGSVLFHSGWASLLSPLHSPAWLMRSLEKCLPSLARIITKLPCCGSLLFFLWVPVWKLFSLGLWYCLHILMSVCVSWCCGNLSGRDHNFSSVPGSLIIKISIINTEWRRRRGAMRKRRLREPGESSVFQRKVLFF